METNGPAPGRSRSLWVVAAGVAVSAAVGALVGTPWGALLLALGLGAGAVVRWITPDPAPEALVVRSRQVDVAVLTTLAVVIGVLSQIVPRS